MTLGGSQTPYVDRTPQTHPVPIPGSSWVTRMTQYGMCRPNISSEAGIGLPRPDPGRSRPVQTGSQAILAGRVPGWFWEGPDLI